MTDLHTHILPGIDDGAQTDEDALALLAAQRAQGVSAVCLTPHFRTERRAEALDTFLAERQQSLARMQAAAEGLKLLLGAEVTFSPALLEMDLAPLCLNGGRTLLVELPLERSPLGLRDVLFELKCRGIIPLIAHVERYQYLLRNMDALVDLIEGGAYAHANASSLLADRHRRSTVFELIRCGCVHALASDTHSIDSRPPLLREGLDKVARKLGQDVRDKLVRNAEKLAAGEKP